MLRFGIIGAGLMGGAHAESIANHPAATLVAVADADADKAAQLAGPHKARGLADAGELASMDGLDAIVVATPTHLRFQHAKAALENGRHVLLEMPMARTAEEGLELAKLADSKHLVLTVNHILRFYPEYAMMRQRLRDGAAGKTGMVRLGRRTPHPRRWYSDFEKSGGVILDAMTHELDYLQWCCGPVKRVLCRGMNGRRPPGTLDYALASLRLEDGTIAHAESSWCHYGQSILEAEFAGTDGLIRYCNQDAVPLEVSLIDEPSGGRRYHALSPLIEPAHYRLFGAFAEAAAGRGENPVPPAEALSALRVALAAIESNQTGRPVSPGVN